MAHDRRAALWESGYDESVEVNQRALIDKVLARYSGEFTVFRELLQNSDDAQSTAAEIRFETEQFTQNKSSGTAQTDSLIKPKLPDLKSALVSQWTFKNNGNVFRDEDWTRLKKIAEGNPDEEKIGAFGVGFYSLFSVTEEPLVTSGRHWMLFYWKDKKDQLFVKRGLLPAAETMNTWTSFEMNLREAAPIPKAFDFIRFLASSITFMTHLSEVSVYFDDHRLARLTKIAGITRDLGLLRDLKDSSDQGIMNVRGIRSSPLTLKAEVMRAVYAVGTEKAVSPIVAKASKASAGQGGFFSALFSSIAGSTTPQRATTPPPFKVAEQEKADSVRETNVTLTLFTADVDVRVDKKLTNELNRSTKKNPPHQLKYDLIYTAKDEYDISVQEDSSQYPSTGNVFQGLRADLHGAGLARIFIGHATGQTTGIGGHMASRFIPTVERESIDLVDRNVAVWNKELLYVGGYLARTAYELEVAGIQRLWNDKILPGTDQVEADTKLITSLYAKSLHVLKFFTFHTSTPSSEVSRLLEAAFFSCSKDRPLNILSSVGVRSASDVRMPDPIFSQFLKQLPFVTPEYLTELPLMVSALQSRGMIRDITFVDVLEELRARPLNETEMVACLKWWVDISRKGANPNHVRLRDELLNAAVLVYGVPGSQSKVLHLASVKTIIYNKSTGRLINMDAPLPDHVMPLSVSKHFDAEELKIFPWRELTVVDWVQWISSPEVLTASVEYDLTSSPQWAERVLDVLTRAWPSLTNDAHDAIASILKDKSCIPTSSGLKTPAASYFSNANIFKDLPIVTLPSGLPVKKPLERVLLILGVRKHVELQLVFDRMIKTGDWTISDLIGYLVAVQTTLAMEEIDKLRVTAAFTRESESDAGPRGKERCRASDLYEPNDTLRKLGLPIIDWSSKVKWKNNSEEAKFLYRLGLRRSPPLETLIGLAASPVAERRSVALKYLLDNVTTRYPEYDPEKFSDVAFVPALYGGIARVGTYKQVFAHADWATLGFWILEPSIVASGGAAKLKIREHPPAGMLVNLLTKTPPKDIATAGKWFSILAGRVSTFSTQQLQMLSKLPIVPVRQRSPNAKQQQNPLSYLPPSQCYFGNESNAQIHSKLFVFVDFGAPANSFLSACGTKREPSIDEIAQTLVANPREFYQLADGPDNFLVELRNLAVNRRLISLPTFTKMQNSTILLGIQRQRRQSPEGGRSSGSADLDEDDWDSVYDLRHPNHIVIADNSNAYQLFGDAVYTAPQEDVLEHFYAELGSKRLDHLVHEDYKTTAEIKHSKAAAELRALILERLPLFLHEHTHARTRLSLSWLNNEQNFVVRTFGKLEVVRKLNFNDVHLVRSQDASAVARRRGSGPLELWLAGHTQIDMYEVSTSLCRLLFESPKVNDALLFMTILSTDLRALKRRGYNVDRILRQQKFDRENAARAREEQQSITFPSSPRPSADLPPPIKPPELDMPGVFRSPSPVSSISTTTEDSASTRTLLPTPQPSGARPTSLMPAAWQNWKRKLAGQLSGTEAGTSIESVLSGLRPGASSGSGLQPRGPAVTPLSSIHANVSMAIKACQSEQGNLVHSQQHMEMVRESLNEGYCDIAGQVGDLDLIGQMGDVKVFVSKDVAHLHDILATKRDALARFIHVISALSGVYGLPLTALHVFCDAEGGLMAFNRSASIFLNLRYFEAWHDADVRSGTLAPAYISWYHTLAHEIAHNLVHAHNSEHEFYFSALCEAYTIPFSGLLASVGVGAGVGTRKRDSD